MELALLYSSAKHEHTAVAFHRLCDNQGATFTLIKTSEYIVGGYTWLSWTSPSLRVARDDAFARLLVMPTIGGDLECRRFEAKRRMPTVIHGSELGPVFGSSLDRDTASLSLDPTLMTCRVTLDNGLSQACPFTVRGSPICFSERADLVEVFRVRAKSDEVRFGAGLVRDVFVLTQLLFQWVCGTVHIHSL